MVPEIIAALKADAEVAALLPVDELTGEPAIFSYWAPESRQPYIVVTHDETLVANMDGTVSSGQLELNIWDEGNSVVHLRKIAFRVIDLLDYTGLANERGSTRIKLRQSGAIQEPTPSVSRWRMTFGTRMLRGAATAARANREVYQFTKTNINTASADDLQTLPRVTSGLASTIVQHRIDNGPFATIEDLLLVNGVGRKTFDAIQGLITT